MRAILFRHAGNLSERIYRTFLFDSVNVRFMKKITNDSICYRAIDYRLSFNSKKSNHQSTSVQHLFKSLLPSIPALPLSSKQLSVSNLFLRHKNHNNSKIVVASNFPHHTTQRSFYSSVKNSTNERIVCFSNLHNLRNSCKNSIFCVISVAFPSSPVKKDFSSQASDHRARSAVGLTFELKKCKKSQRRLPFSCRFVHSNQGMMVWVSDYDKPDNSVNK